MPMPHQREVVIEVPRDLLQSKQSHLANDIPRERIIAIDLARRAALSTFPTVAERAMELYEEDLPIWCENRFHVMNERPCDYDENGTSVEVILGIRVFRQVPAQSPTAFRLAKSVDWSERKSGSSRLRKNCNCPLWFTLLPPYSWLQNHYK
jgi:hypothetical protein